MHLARVRGGNVDRRAWLRADVVLQIVSRVSDNLTSDRYALIFGKELVGRVPAHNGIRGC